MHKIAALEKLKGVFELHQLGMTRQLLYNDNGEKTEFRTHFLGLVTLALAECGDHLYNLRMLHEHGSHGVAGTVSEDFDPYDEDNPEVARVYSAYAEMAYYLSAESSVSPLTLSPLLRRFLDHLPESARTRVGDYEKTGWQLMTRDADNPTGPFRPMTQDELAREAESELLAAFETTLFAETYDEDMARVAEIVAQRLDLAEALALIGPLPTPEPPLSEQLGDYPFPE